MFAVLLRSPDDREGWLGISSVAVELEVGR